MNQWLLPKKNIKKIKLSFFLERKKERKKEKKKRKKINQDD